MDIKISACTITKNEEKNIARSIESYKDYVDEIIIVDTGSTDSTVEIAKSLGAKVINFEWINDFSAAKNCALEAATGDWILFLDADEWIRDNGGMKIQTVVKRAISAGYDSISLRMFNLSDEGTVTDINSSLRLFVNKPHIRYIRKIHEHLYDSINKRPLISLKADDITLNHSGYSESISQTKVKRNKELLEKNYMSGDIAAIDYFYLARENLTLNPERTKQFLEILIQDENKMKEIKKLDIANHLYDLKIKLSKTIENKYSFEENMQMIEEAIKDFPDDPVYYYYKYLLYKRVGDYTHIDLLKKALELDKDYEKKAAGNTNSFTRYKANVLCELGYDSLNRNNTMEAMEYFVRSIQTGDREAGALRGLLYIIQAQDINDKIAFLNSIYDIKKESDLEFIVQSLRLTQYKDVFLYYFVKYYKSFNKVDISLFTSMMINKNFENAASKYLKILLDENDDRAAIMVTSAIIAGELKEFYDINKNSLPPMYRRIISGYLYDSTVEDLTKNEEEIIKKIVEEISYIADETVFEKLKKEFDNSEMILRVIVENYFVNRSYKQVIQEVNKFIENDLSDEFAGEITALLGICFYRIQDITNAKLYLTQAMEIGHIMEEVALVYENIIKANDNPEEIRKFELYKYLLKKFIQAQNYISCEKINDIITDNVSDDVDRFKEEVAETINLTEGFKNVILEYANKLNKMGKIYLAEEYYKILLRCNYNIGICYYNLGDIYNKIGCIDLSYLCYKRAFETSIDFPMSVLSKEHKNIMYLYSIKQQLSQEKCPICGKIGTLKNCHQYLEMENLTDEDNIIKKYRYCEECNHIYADNYNENECAEYITERDGYIFNAYDIADKIDDNSKLLVVSDNDLLYNILSKDFESEYLNASLETSNDLTKLISQIKKYKDKTIVTIINNIESDFEEDAEMPLWSKPGTINAYSKKSITKILSDNNCKNIKIYNSKFLRGKMVVIADIV